MLPRKNKKPSLLEQLKQLLPAWMTDPKAPGAPNPNPVAPMPTPAAKLYDDSLNQGNLTRRRRRSAGLMATLGQGGISTQ